jgi:transposase-like protein
MKKTNKFSPEVRERAVRLVHDRCGEHPSLWAAVESVAPKIGCVPQTSVGRRREASEEPLERIPARAGAPHISTMSYCSCE